jgi:transposase InsO family protein
LTQVQAPGDLVNRSTFGWAHGKDVGRCYAQVVVDVFSSLAFATLYTSNLPVDLAALLCDRLLPFSYETLSVKIQAVLTDHGRERCGRAENHPYERIFQPDPIQHHTTKVRGPRPNSFVERLKRSLLDGCFRIPRSTLC